MKNKLKKATLIVAMLAILLTAVSPALAQEPTPAPTLPPAPTPCMGTQVSGKVVAVDPLTGTLTIDTGAGLCTVTLKGSYDHPIVTLLGKYFGDISAETFAAALNDTKGCVLQDPATLAYSWVDCGTAGAVPVSVAGQNADGTFSVKLADGTLVNVPISDPAAVEKIVAALKALAVLWNLDGAGDVVQVSDQIAMYHDQGIGFGVLVKLYFLAASAQTACLADPASPQCAVTVQSLVDEFKSGVGMGQLFHKYGKPAGTGVGHVRNGLPKDHGNGNGKGNGNGDHQPPGQVKDKNKNKGLCKPHGNGNGNGKGNCP